MKNKKIIIFSLVFVLILIVTYIFIKGSCNQKIEFVPGYESGGFGNVGPSKTEPYYKIVLPIESVASAMSGGNIKRFKTKGEAMSYCMSIKFSSKN